MRRVVAWAQGLGLALGGPGLFLLTFLDASFVSLPEICDLLFVWMVTHHKQRMIYYASMATVGSLAGSLVLYWLAWKGGEAVMRRWFDESRIERGMATFHRYGTLVLFFPAIAPPPVPVKIFVLLAGVARLPRKKFVAAIGIGRALRYFVEGLLAVWYGEAALGYIHAHGKEVALASGLAVLLGGIAYYGWQAWRQRSVTEV